MTSNACCGDAYDDWNWTRHNGHHVNCHYDDYSNFVNDDVVAHDDDGHWMNTPCEKQSRVSEGLDEVDLDRL